MSFYASISSFVHIGPNINCAKLHALSHCSVVWLFAVICSTSAAIKIKSAWYTTKLGKYSFKLVQPVLSFKRSWATFRGQISILKHIHLSKNPDYCTVQWINRRTLFYQSNMISMLFNRSLPYAICYAKSNVYLSADIVHREFPSAQIK